MKKYNLLFAILSAVSFFNSCQKPSEERTKLDKEELKIENKKVAVKDETRVVNFSDAPLRLEKWFRYQKNMNSNLSISGFRPTDTIVRNEFSRLNIKKPADFGEFMIYSPSKNYALDFYSYENELRKTSDGKLEVVAGSPESNVLLFNEKTGTAQSLLFCGTPCSFEDGYWINDNELVISGSMESDDLERKLTMWHVDLNKNRIVIFQNPDSKVTIQTPHYSELYFNK